MTKYAVWKCASEYCRKERKARITQLKIVQGQDGKDVFFFLIERHVCDRCGQPVKHLFPKDVIRIETHPSPNPSC